MLSISIIVRYYTIVIILVSTRILAIYLKKKKRIPKNIFEINIHIWRNDIQFFDGQEFESSANILSRNIQILEKKKIRKSDHPSDRWIDRFHWPIPLGRNAVLYAIAI